MSDADYEREWNARFDAEAKLAACKAEVAAAVAEATALQGILIDNTHALRTVLHGHSTAMPCSPKEAWELTLAEVAAAVARTQRLEDVLQRLAEPHRRNELDGECDWDGHPWPCPEMSIILAAAAESEKP